MKTLKQQFQSREECFGLFCSIPSAVALEQIAIAGYNFVIIDTEHTLIDGQQLELLILTAKSYQLHVLVRVSTVDSPRLFPLLDAGVSGIVFARIETKQQAEKAVSHCHYAPLGIRGLNTTRDSHYGETSLLESIEQAKQNTLVIIMIETLQGLHALPQIVEVNGIDMILEGAADLSQSMGLSWQTSHKKVKSAIDTMQTITQDAHVGFCALPRTADDMDHWRKRNVNAFVIGDDRSIIRRAHQRNIQLFKGQ